MSEDRIKGLAGQIDAAKAAANGFREWTRRHPDSVQGDAKGARQQATEILADIRRVGEAASRPMAIGVFGESQAGKSYLVSSVTGGASGSLLARFGSELLHFIGDVNPSGTNTESTGVVTRFVAQGDVPFPDYPVMLTLLSESDIAKLLANSYHTDLAQGVAVTLAADEVAEMLGRIEVGNSMDPDMKDRVADIAVDLQRYFTRRFPDSKLIDAMGPNWDSLATILVAGSVSQRTEAYSVLWGGDTHFTAVLEKLAGVLERLGHATEVWTTTNVFRTKTVILVSTLDRMMEGTGETSPVRTADGHTTDVDHATISALIAELRIVMDEKPHPLFDNADLLDFPGARTRMNADAVSDEIMGTAVKRGKVEFLFDRYLERRELTAMVLCIKDSNQNVQDLPEMIERWVNLTHGTEAEERGDPGLFIVQTMADKLLSGRSDSAERALEERISASFERFWLTGDRDDNAGAERRKSWLAEWSTGRPFDNTYWLRNTKLPTPAILGTGEPDSSERHETGFSPDYQQTFDNLREATSKVPLLNRHFAQPTEAWDAMLTLNDGGRSYLLQHLKTVCRPGRKSELLAGEFSRLRTPLHDLMCRSYADGDQQRRYEQRMQTARVIVSSLEPTVKQRRFGLLLQHLYIPEPAVRAIMQKLHWDRQDQVTGAQADVFEGAFSKLRVGQPEPTTRIAEKHAIFAQHVVEMWADNMNHKLKNANTLNYFHLDEEIATTLASELSEGARTHRLPEKLATLSRELDQFTTDFARLVPHQSRRATSLVNTFVNYLGLVPGDVQSTIEPERTIFDRPRVAKGELPELGPTRVDNEIIEGISWMEALLLLAESNASADDGMGGIDPQANTELGELVEKFEAA
jgi:hypothetical protein